VAEPGVIGEALSSTDQTETRVLEVGGSGLNAMKMLMPPR
jgi:hypothetical protein